MLEKSIIFAALSMTHSSPDIVKNSTGFFCAAVLSVKERNGCLDHVAPSLPH